MIYQIYRNSIRLAVDNSLDNGDQKAVGQDIPSA